MLHFRRITIGALMVPLYFASPANAQGNSDTHAAYRAALKCYVANGEARAERLDAHDNAGAERYEVGGQRSFDGAVKLGRMLGLANRQLNHDIESAQAAELPMMVRDRRYFINAVADCKGLGLMD